MSVVRLVATFFYPKRWLIVRPPAPKRFVPLTGYPFLTIFDIIEERQPTNISVITRRLAQAVLGHRTYTLTRDEVEDVLWDLWVHRQIEVDIDFLSITVSPEATLSRMRER